MSNGYVWWASLRHGGMLIAPGKLSTQFQEEIEPLSSRLEDQLRRDVTRMRNGDSDHLSILLNTVLEDILQLPKEQWQKGSAISHQWSKKAITGEQIKPRRIWQSNENGISFPVFVADKGAGRNKLITRLGIGRGRRSVSRVIEWLRKSQLKLGLLTNGRQWRLIYAGPDHEAWCEWDIDFWFEEGKPSAQVDGLRILLNGITLKSDGSSDLPLLLETIEASRQGQAELSASLGERVRQAVELLIKESSTGIGKAYEQANFSTKDLYIAANRMIMRCVIILFAEARDLLPRDNVIYHNSYGIQGLREQLAVLSGGHAQERLRHSYTAWPRLLALFQLMYHGSDHQALPIPAYGGGLFTPGDINSTDLIRQAMSAFEFVNEAPSDAAIYTILNLLTRSKIKVRQGNRNITIDAPVDFSDLSSEYIGILYQGLLDFELRQAAEDEAILFLNLGDQPALPLSRLENLSDKELTELVKKFKTAKKKKVDGEETSEDEEELEEEETESIDHEIVIEDDKQQLHERAMVWAMRAVKAGNLVPKPRGRSQTVLAAYEKAVETVAQTLIAQIIPSGQWYLVRWGGTRKGSGTFYTRPQLAIPLVQRTLKPLAYEDVNGEWIPNLPEEILDLKLCDPAMGSGSLLVAGLRFLTQALYESLYYHHRIQEHGAETLCRLADGQLTNSVLEETLPVPIDDPNLEDRLKARLKRYVVERCIYGVDLDPLAVELSKLSLWIETMDSSLPFEFLDHKLKCGNALVGCWLDRFQDYPVLAWEREGGDNNHNNYVHHNYEKVYTSGKKKGQKEVIGSKWTDAIKAIRAGRLKEEMKNWVLSRGQVDFIFAQTGYTAENLHEEALTVLNEIYQIPIHETERKATIYREKVLNNNTFNQLKFALDTWCAIWFWPGNALDIAPTPASFQAPSEETTAIIKKLAQENRFFHWELEFPDVFAAERKGFDAIIKNPPWDILKPKSQEFFSNIDPLYRTYGKQVAVAWQKQQFENNSQIERDWLVYNAFFRALSNWMKQVAHPFGDPLHEDSTNFSFSRSKKENSSLHNMWRYHRKDRVGYADSEHPFQYQGSADINSYKAFLELGHALLQRKGQLGAIVPSGLYTDKGSGQLRNLFLQQSQWKLLFGFINWNKIFASVYYRFKFCIAIVQKGGKTKHIKTAFSRYHIQDWENAEQITFDYTLAQIEKFSPLSKSILEIKSKKDIDILMTCIHEGIPLGECVSFTQQFDVTSDSKLFSNVTKWRKKGFNVSEYGLWNDENNNSLTPILEGRMINQFDPSEKGWVSGKGRTAQWDEIDWDDKVLKPQYLMDLKIYSKSEKRIKYPIIAYMKIASATNSRSFIGTIIHDTPSVYSICILDNSQLKLTDWLNILANLNSFIYDFQLRMRLGGLNITGYLLKDTFVLPLNSFSTTNLNRFVIGLALPHRRFAHLWLNFIKNNSNNLYHKHIWFKYWAITPHERLRLRTILDAVIAHLYQLDESNLRWILYNCDQSKSQMSNKAFYRTLDPKGFWRVDKDKDPELRHTVLTLIAFRDLQEKGIDAFLAQNDGEGWMIPETVRLADYNLGHDDRAEEAQPVASRLGPRFLPWQLESTPEQSWAECERHATNLHLLLGDLIEEPETESIQSNSPSIDQTTVEPIQRDLFGNVVPNKKKRK